MRCIGNALGEGRGWFILIQSHKHTGTIFSAAGNTLWMQNTNCPHKVYSKWLNGVQSHVTVEFQLLSESRTLWILHTPPPQKMNVFKNTPENTTYWTGTIYEEICYIKCLSNYFLNLKCSGGGEKVGGREIFGERNGISLLSYLNSLRFSKLPFPSCWRAECKRPARARGTVGFQ